MIATLTEALIFYIKANWDNEDIRVRTAATMEFLAMLGLFRVELVPEELKAPLCRLFMRDRRFITLRKFKKIDRKYWKTP